jgi:hypothetical protein
MRAKRTIAVGLIAAVLAACVLIWLWRSTPKITEDQVKRIQPGMTLTEVNAILGCRPGNYTWEERFLPLGGTGQSLELQNGKDRCKVWAADKPEPRYTDASGPDRQDAIVVRVWFDENGRVVGCVVWGSDTYSPPSFRDHIRRLLRLIGF